MIEGVVLIGGKSSRYGGDKFVLEINGRSFTDNALENFSSAGITHTAVSISPNVNYNGGGRSYEDIFLERGALSGIHSSLFNTVCESVFILACDLPLIGFEFIRFLSEISEDLSKFDAIVPKQPDGKLQPVCAVYRKESCLPVLDGLLKNNAETPSVRHFLKELNVKVIEYGEYSHLQNAETMFVNVNREADYEQMLKIIKLSPQTNA